VRRRALVRLALAAAAAALAAEWMRGPGAVLAVGLLALAVLASWAARGDADEPVAPAWRWMGAALLAAVAAVALATTLKLRAIERDWPRLREAAIERASRRLGGALEEAVTGTRRLAERAADALALPPPDAFTLLATVVGREGPTCSAILFDRRGRATAWAGPQRVALSPEGPALSAITTPFYLWLVARRQTNLGTAVSATLLARDDAVPPAGLTLADRFQRQFGVGLQFLDARAAPADPDVFDYVLPGRLGGDTLFAVRPVPPGQGAVRQRVLGGARRAEAWLVLATLLAAAAAAVRAGLAALATLAPAGAAVLVLARAPLKETFGPGSVFWPDTYFQGLLGPLSASAGTLLLLGTVLAMVGAAVWRHGLRATWPRRLIAFGIAVLAPYLLQDLARGITPPALGVSAGLWLSWQVALVVAASATVLVAAALVRGEAEPAHAGAWPFLAGGIAVGLAVAGLWLWQPEGAWPEWYPYLWVPALVIALRPMPLRGTLATVAVVAGSAAALLTWGATAEGRMDLAARDVEALGDQTDPVAVALLDRLVHETPVDRPPATAGELYLVWRISALGAQGYPAELAVFSPAGERVLALDLAELDIPVDMAWGVAQEAAREALPIVRPVLRVPGLHGIAAIPLAGGPVLTIAVGPRSQLVAPTRLARFLSGELDEAPAPYDLLLSPPEQAGVVPTARVVWRRAGWQVRGERVIALPGGARHAHAVVDLGGASPLLQRGALVLVLDVALLVALWSLVAAVDGRAVPAVRAWWPRALRSLRTRLTVSLAVFFVVPTAGFAMWTYGRLGDQLRGARELLLTRSLRDAAAALAAEPDPVAALRPLARRSGAELALMVGGQLAGTSAPVLVDLGLADRLVPGPVFARLAWGDEVEVAVAQEAAPAPTLVGYRLLERGPPDRTAIVAAPELLGEVALRRRAADLGITVMVGSLIGVVAALLLSGVAARALARPLQRLRADALALGAGRAPDAPPESMPVELEPVRAAIVQAAGDVEAGRQAQRVIAWGEMARQVAHEIKNPLTPIRLGIQHLLRLHRERPAEFGPVLANTGERILAEITRLDAIARAFSRFAVPTDEGGGAPPEPVELGAVAGEVVRLYQLGDDDTTWTLEATPGVRGLARRDELVEVLVNLCENARDAGARHVVVRVRADARPVVEVRDDGRGIPPELLPRVFEPRFSTTTSGAGLGLAITRRLVESWGGAIRIAASDGGGTVVRIELTPPGDPPAPAVPGAPA
jgi:signal transduction histidine kinase